MTTPDSIFLSFSNTYLSSSYTVRKLTDTDGVDRIFIGVRNMSEAQLQNIGQGLAPTLVFKLDTATANQIWPLISASTNS